MILTIITTAAYAIGNDGVNDIIQITEGFLGKRKMKRERKMDMGMVITVVVVGVMTVNVVFWANHTIIMPAML